MKKHEPVTPGEILLEEFLKPMGLSQNRLAREIGVSSRLINEIVNGRRPISAETDLRLCRFFGLSKGYWLRARGARYRGGREQAGAVAEENNPLV